MIKHLMVLQFPFLYCISLVAGLIVYGSDFDSLAGQCYLVLFVTLPVLHFLLAPVINRLSTPLFINIVLVCGILLALSVYKLLHFSYWDEHNLTQAILVSLLGLCSYLLAAIYASNFFSKDSVQFQQAALALFWVALAWGLSLFYPLASLFVIACIFILALVWGNNISVKDKNEVMLDTDSKLHSMPRMASHLLLFVIIMEAGLAVWDFQIDSRWALTLFVLFITAAVMMLVLSKSRKNIFVFMVMSVMAACLLPLVWPAIILSPLHAVLLGMGLGLLLVTGKPSFVLKTPMTVSMLVFLGLLTGYLFMSNLEYTAIRIVFETLVMLIVVISFIKAQGLFGLKVSNSNISSSHK